MEIEGGSWKDKFSETMIALTSCLSGFGFIYCALGVSTSRIAYVLFRYQTILLQIGGVIIFLYSFSFLGVLKIPSASRSFMRVGGSLLVGSILGLAYQPCITPVLSGIYNSVKDPITFSTGLLSLIFYALGLVSAFAITGFFLILFFSSPKLKGTRPVVINICGLAMLAIAVLILLQKMTVYKSFLVGWWS